MVVGCGAVGSFAIEALARSGVGHLIVVDFDSVEETNINRQLFALDSTVGQKKVHVAAHRIHDINPEITVEALDLFFDENTEITVTPDYIIDAIDSISDKMLLMLRACETDAVFFSSMGAARKLDSSRISVAEFWKVKGCPLGSVLRRKFRASGEFPIKKFKCVYSDEQPSAFVEGGLGSLHHITAVFGLTMAGLVVNDVCAKIKA